MRIFSYFRSTRKPKKSPPVPRKEVSGKVGGDTGRVAPMSAAILEKNRKKRRKKNAG